MLFNNEFVLASTSKSRKKILKNCGLVFLCKKPLCNEEALKKNMLKNKTIPKKISLELSRLKALSVSKKNKTKFVIGSDTVISFKKKIVNKARNIKEAKQKIKRLSGKKHEIYSSVSVFYNMKEVWNTTEKTTIKIRNLSEKEINKYLFVAGKDVLDSVGCYQIESLGPQIIENIKGDFFNVMGLPLFKLLKYGFNKI